MMRDALNRKLPALSHRNTPEAIIAGMKPTANVEWLDNINFKALHEKWARDEQEEGL
jgi:hypothetical protein